MKNYKQALEQLVAELDNNPNIKVLEFQIQEPLQELSPLLAKIPTPYQDIFPKELIEMYKQMNGFKLVWEPIETLQVKYNNWTLPWNYPPCYNELLPFHQVFVNHSQIINWFEDEQEYPLDLAYHFFLDHDQEEQGTFLLGTNQAFHLHYIHSQGEDVDKLDMNIDEWFDAFIAERGYFCWQDRFIKNIYSDDVIGNERYKNWFKALFGDLR